MKNAKAGSEKGEGETPKTNQGIDWARWVGCSKSVDRVIRNEGSL